VRIQEHLRATSNRHALRKFINGRKFPIELYYESIEFYQTGFEHPFGDGRRAGNEILAKMLALTLQDAGAMYAHVESVGHDVEDEAEWAQIYLAAAWIILESYEGACERGDWPKQ
jgi:hypothetical protein